MPTSRDLEHDGGEFFEQEVFPNREEYFRFKKDVEDQVEKMKDLEKENKQKEWMNLENPYLWEPVDID